MSEEKRFPYEKIAKLDNPQRWEHQPPSPMVELIAGWKPQSVLDIGVGTGYIAVPLAKKLGLSRIIGLDVEPRMLEELEKRARAADQTIERLEAPSDSIPLDDNSVEVAVMVNLYHELDDRVAYLREARRVLIPDGRMLICDWNPEATLDFGPPRDHRVAQDEVERELETAGFEKIDFHEMYEGNYVLSARA